MSCSHVGRGSSKHMSNKRTVEERRSRAQIEEGADRSTRTSLEDILLRALQELRRIIQPRQSTPGTISIGVSSLRRDRKIDPDRPNVYP